MYPAPLKTQQQFHEQFPGINVHSWHRPKNFNWHADIDTRARDASRRAGYALYHSLAHNTREATLPYAKLAMDLSYSAQEIARRGGTYNALLVLWQAEKAANAAGIVAGVEQNPIYDQMVEKRAQYALAATTSRARDSRGRFI